MKSPKIRIIKPIATKVCNELIEIIIIKEDSREPILEPKTRLLACRSYNMNILNMVNRQHNALFLFRK